MIIRKAHGHGGARRWYDRKVSPKDGACSRQYHAFGLARVVNGQGESFWRLIVGKWCFAFGYSKRGGADA
jgi:hypothetical protein